VVSLLPPNLRLFLRPCSRWRSSLFQRDVRKIAANMATLTTATTERVFDILVGYTCYRFCVGMPPLSLFDFEGLTQSGRLVSVFPPICSQMKNCNRRWRGATDLFNFLVRLSLSRRSAFCQLLRSIERRCSIDIFLQFCGGSPAALK